MAIPGFSHLLDSHFVNESFCRLTSDIFLITYTSYDYYMLFFNYLFAQLYAPDISRDTNPSYFIPTIFIPWILRANYSRRMVLRRLNRASKPV